MNNIKIYNLIYSIYFIIFEYIYIKKHHTSYNYKKISSNINTYFLIKFYCIINVRQHSREFIRRQ